MFDWLGFLVSFDQPRKLILESGLFDHSLKKFGIRFIGVIKTVKIRATLL